MTINVFKKFFQVLKLYIILFLEDLYIFYNFFSKSSIQNYVNIYANKSKK